MHCKIHTPSSEPPSMPAPGGAHGHGLPASPPRTHTCLPGEELLQHTRCVPGRPHGARLSPFVDTCRLVCFWDKMHSVRGRGSLQTPCTVEASAPSAALVTYKHSRLHLLSGLQRPREKATGRDPHLQPPLGSGPLRPALNCQKPRLVREKSSKHTFSALQSPLLSPSPTPSWDCLRQE